MVQVERRAEVAGRTPFQHTHQAVTHLVAGDRRIIIDLGLPRNVDPDVSTITGIELLDLETISLHAPLEELSATRDARALVSSVAGEFAASTTEQQLTPAIVALRAHVFGLLEAEITRAHSRGDEDGRIEAALRHLTGVLLHTPSVRARQLARAGDGQSFSDAVTALFGIAAVSDTTTQLTRDDLSA